MQESAFFAYSVNLYSAWKPVLMQETLDLRLFLALLRI